MLQQKDPIPKTVGDACRISFSWKNKYGNINKRLTKANDRVAFTTTGTEEKKAIRKKK